MLVEIEKIKIKDRIRKDFGNIQELADDIKENGLINPPVITPDTYELITGERRTRAMKLLGYQQIEVRPMAVKDAEHQLNLEISENEARKDFSKAERIDYARRLERIESLKARERQAISTVGANPQLMEKFPQAENGSVRDIVASKLNIGSGKQYEKEKFIVDNSDSLTPEDFAEWDEGKLSTNKAFMKIKKEKELLEEQVKQLELSNQNIQNYERLTCMIPELEELIDTGIVTKNTALALMRNLPEMEQKNFIESIPTDKKYTQKQMDEKMQKYKNRISELVQQKTKTETVEVQVDKPETLTKIKNLEEKLEKKAKENEELSSSLIKKEKMINEAIGASTNYQLTSHCSEITLKMINFVKEMSQYDYMAESFNEIPIATRIEYEKCIKSVKKWADRILGTINQEKEMINM